MSNGKTAQFKPGIVIPFEPFCGVMGVAPGAYRKKFGLKGASQGEFAQKEISGPDLRIFEADNQFSGADVRHR